MVWGLHSWRNWGRRKECDREIGKSILTFFTYTLAPSPVLQSPVLTSDHEPSIGSCQLADVTRTRMDATPRDQFFICFLCIPIFHQFFYSDIVLSAGLESLLVSRFPVSVLLSVVVSGRSFLLRLDCRVECLPCQHSNNGKWKQCGNRTCSPRARATFSTFRGIRAVSTRTHWAITSTTITSTTTTRRPRCTSFANTSISWCRVYSITAGDRHFRH